MARQPAQLDFILADLDQFTRTEVIALGLDVVANLQDAPPAGTPIDTGWASANWIPSVGEPTILPGNRDPSPGDIQARRAAGQAGLNEVLGWHPADGPIFASNYVPYIARLNSGHSTQSPPGFVQKALERAVVDAEARHGGARR